jgi:hypothetical protein
MNKYTPEWELDVSDIYQHAGVFYYFWRKEDPKGWIYNVTTDRNFPPGSGAGGYGSKEVLIKAKFGKTI